MPYVVAVALIDGDVWINSFGEKRFTDKKTLALMKNISVKENSEYTKMFDNGGTVNASDITITLKNGKVIKKKQIYSRGHPMNQMTDQEVEAKFRRLTTKFISPDSADYLIESIWKMERTDNIERLFPIYKIKE